MNRMTPLYLSSLRQVDWQWPEDFTYPSDNAQSWLLEQGSLSRLMAQRCQQLSITQHDNQWLEPAQLDFTEVAWLTAETCLLRQVILAGDTRPWVFGRTLIPQSSLQGQSDDLTQQGAIPLGLTVFNSDHVRRDGLQVGWAMTSDGPLLARRSRLWMNHKPMLVAELFLPDCPIYAKESV
ncbi:chorismate lyase [Vibrio injensis]|uniref:chorismate lyase n=1 Tax=Vibrio injensis TaxID=1307414 RepID=UPI00278BC1BF|nr:chorismate lyase [Vibrio injensis]